MGTQARVHSGPTCALMLNRAPARCKRNGAGARALPPATNNYPRGQAMNPTNKPKVIVKVYETFPVRPSEAAVGQVTLEQVKRCVSPRPLRRRRKGAKKGT